MRAIRLFLALCFGLFVGGYSAYSFAGYALPSPPAGFAVTAQGMMYKAPASVAAVNGVFNPSIAVNVAGKAVQMPATMRLAANAGQFAATAVRANPWLAVGAVATWLLTEHLEFTDDQWMVSVPAQGNAFPAGLYYNGAGWSSCGTAVTACSANTIGGHFLAFTQVTYPGTNHALTFPSPTIARVTLNRASDGALRTYEAGLIQVSNYGCPSGFDMQGSTCVPMPNMYAATDADWARLGSSALPFEAAEPIARAVPLPVQQPELSPVTAPLGDPYADPITGQPYRDMVRVTPAPTTESPFRVRTDTYREPVESLDPDAEPVTGPEAPPKEEISEDPGLEFEDEEFPDVPDLYEQKYPDGIGGVWDERKSELEQTSLFGLATSFTSGVPSGGTCPSWSFNFSSMGLGSHQLAPPCIVWPFIKALMIISALFVARRLVFGG